MQSKSNQSQNINKEAEPPLFFNSKDRKDKIKKFFLFIALNLFSLSRVLKKIIVFLIKQFKKIIAFIFLNIHNFIKILCFYIYKVYLLFKKQIQKTFSFLKRYLIFYIAFVVIIVLIVFDNLKANEINFDMTRQETIIYQLFNNQQEEFVTETDVLSMPINFSNQFLKSNIQPFPETELKNQEKTIMVQEGTVLVKPNISVTVETPQIRIKPIQYIIKARDVISGIAKKFNISINTILWENNLKDYSIIRPGDELTILPVTGVVHKVSEGESLEKIAKKYKVAVEEILKINELADNGNIRINQKIIIPGGEKYFPSIFPKKELAKKEWRLESLLNKFIPSKDKGNFIWPTSGHRMTQYFHWGHPGVDISGKNYSSPIYASADGIIGQVIYSNRGYGNHIIINHRNNTKTLYGHMSKIFVENGQRVKKGQVIGLLGSTGRSTGPHLHFEIRINGKKINPLKYIR
ncbi:MAG: peptidoglycan DD-metalloendopeptidase family protein [Candidatus Kuenenbacteria bacterium]